MKWVIIILYSLYFGLLPFDNLKELSGDTITKTLGLALIAVLSIIFFVKKEKKLKINFFNIYISIIFITYSITYFIIFGISDSSYIRFCFLFLLFFLSSQLEIKEKALIKILDYSSFIISIISLSSIFLNLKLNYIDRTHYYIWNNMSVDANIYCSTLIFPILYLLNKLFDKNINHKFFSTILLIPMIASMFVSGSRGGLLAIAVGVISLMIFDNSQVSNKKIKILYLIIFIALIYLIIPYLPDNIVNRLSFSAVIKDKASDRFEIWKYAISKFSSSNLFQMIFGYGFLSFRSALNLRSVSHNLIIQTLIEGGIIMITIFLSLYIKLLKYFKEKKSYIMISYMLAVLIMSCSLDVIISRFLWNSFIIINFFINYYSNKEKYKMEIEVSMVF